LAVKGICSNLWFFGQGEKGDENPRKWIWTLILNRQKGPRSGHSGDSNRRYRWGWFVISGVFVHVGRFEKPKPVEFADRLPRSPAGKVLKRLLKERYQFLLDVISIIVPLKNSALKSGNSQK